MTEKRRYDSPIRAAQARATREAILSGVARCLARMDESELTIDAVAEEAGVERRTVFRHFDGREAMLEAFWPWFNARQPLPSAPTTPAELIAAPRVAFARFDAVESLMRASLHSASGRAARARGLPERRKVLEASLARVLAGLPEAERRRVLGLAQLLCSAAAWEGLRDLGGLSGAEAGDAAAWTLGLVLAAAGAGAWHTPT